MDHGPSLKFYVEQAPDILKFVFTKTHISGFLIFSYYYIIVLWFMNLPNLAFSKVCLEEY